MRKLITLFRYILLMSLVLFIVIFARKYFMETYHRISRDELSFSINLMFIVILAFIVLNIIDIFLRRNKINTNIKYNLINVVGLLVTNLLFVRILFDKTLVFNIMKGYMYEKIYFYDSLYSFLEYNSLVIIVILLLIITYRFVSIKNVTKHNA